MLISLLHCFKNLPVKVIMLFFLLVSSSLADDLLNQINSRMIKAPLTRGDFVQTKQLKVLQSPLQSSGHFIYQQAKGIIWQTTTPIASQLLINETHLLTEQGQQPLPAALGKLFQALLAANLTQLTDDFLMNGTINKTSWQVVLLPKEDLLKKAISQITLSGNSELRAIEIIETNGNKTHMQFNNLIHPNQLTPTETADFALLSS